MTAELDLGSLELESRASGHRVHVHSTANFAASGKDETDLQVLLTRPRLTAPNEQPPWIRAGANLTLELTVQIENFLSASATREVIESLSARLMHAKLWDQLRFARPSLQTCTSADSYRIELRLKYEPSAGEDSKKTVHKLGGHVPFYDVRPPAEIVQAVFENAHLHIRVTGPRHSRQASTPKGRLQRVKNHFPRRSDEPPFQLSIDRETDVSFNEVGGEDSMEDETEAHGMIDDDDHDDAESQMLFSQSELYEDGDTSFLSGCTYPKRKYHTTYRPDIACEDFDQDIADVTDLIEMSVGIAVLGPRRRRKRRSTLLCKDLQPLSSVAPSVWLPGYLPSIADRSVFSPTIAHALTSVLGRTAPGIQKHGHLDTAASFVRHLWRTSERVTYDLQAAKPIKAAFSSEQADAVQLKFTDDILEAGQETHLRLYVDGDDEDDLFDDEPEDEIGGIWPDDESFDMLDFNTEMDRDIGPDSQLPKRDDLSGNEYVDDATHSMASVGAYSSTRTATYALNSADKPAAAFEDDMLSVSSDTDMLSEGERTASSSVALQRPAVYLRR